MYRAPELPSNTIEKLNDSELCKEIIDFNGRFDDDHLNAYMPELIKRIPCSITNEKLMLADLEIENIYKKFPSKSWATTVNEVEPITLKLFTLGKLITRTNYIHGAGAENLKNFKKFLEYKGYNIDCLERNIKDLNLSNIDPKKVLQVVISNLRMIGSELINPQSPNQKNKGYLN